MSGKGNKLQKLIHWRIQVTLCDQRRLVGEFYAYDKHLNLVINECDEVRTIIDKKTQESKEEKRTLGFVVVRGEEVVSITPLARPAQHDSRAKAAAAKAAAGPGQAKAAGRGVAAPLGQPAMQSAPIGLAAPAAGLGAPASRVMGGPPGGPPPSFGRGGPGGMMPPGPPGYGRGFGGPPPMAMGRGGPPPPGMGRGGPPGFGPPPMLGRGGPPPGYGGPPGMGRGGPPGMGRGGPPPPGSY